MEICRLCLQYTDTEGPSQTNPETISTLLKFLPHVNRTLLKTPIICEVCVDNISTAGKFVKNVICSEAKILNQVRSLKVEKINLKGFYRKENKPLGWSVCRICVKVINSPKIFLCESDTNILRHDFIKIMLKFCNITMDFQLSFNPVMCMSCWENLQIIYSFKKDYLEVDRKIRLYCRVFNIPIRSMTVETLLKIKKFFSEDFADIIAAIKEEDSDQEQDNLPVEKENPFCRRSKRIRSLKKFTFKEEFDNKYDVKITPKRWYCYFCTEDNELLMKLYYELTRCEEKTYRGFWQLFAKKWLELKPDRPLNGSRLSLQIKNIKRKRLLTKECLEKIKGEVREQFNLKPQLNSVSTLTKHQRLPTADCLEKIRAEVIEKFNSKPQLISTSTSNSNSTLPDSDSDDSFSEEAVHSSFTPQIKLEPLSDSDSDIEVCMFEPLLEPKQEVVSDCDSLPELERMDIPPLQFKIENIYSLDVKREALNNYMAQEDDTEELRKNRRESLRHHNKAKDMYKCTSCSFECETKFEGVINRHNLLHQKGNLKLQYCPYCPFRIASTWMLKKHLKKHRVEDELPVLQPNGLISARI